METTKSSPPTSGPDWWFQGCLEAGHPEKELRKLDFTELYLLAGKVIHESHRQTTVPTSGRS